MSPLTTSLPAGVGLGLRSQHFEQVVEGRPVLPFFEALTDNYLADGGPALAWLERVRALYPLSFHGVGLSLGSSDPLDEAYLDRVANAVDRFEPSWVSDHLCWTSVDGRHLHELLPLPYTDEVATFVAERILRVQDRLKRRIGIENVSAYLEMQPSEMPEWEFLALVAERADCEILFDVNNIYVSGTNLGFDPQKYISEVPAERVVQLHLAGYSVEEDLLLDSHGSPVQDPVWKLYRNTLEKLGPKPTIIEWDKDVPDFDTLLNEARLAQTVFDEALRAG